MYVDRKIYPGQFSYTNRFLEVYFDHAYQSIDDTTITKFDVISGEVKGTIVAPQGEKLHSFGYLSSLNKLVVLSEGIDSRQGLYSLLVVDMETLQIVSTTPLNTQYYYKSVYESPQLLIFGNSMLLSFLISGSTPGVTNDPDVLGSFVTTFRVLFAVSVPEFAVKSAVLEYSYFSQPLASMKDGTSQKILFHRYLLDFVNETANTEYKILNLDASHSFLPGNTTIVADRSGVMSGLNEEPILAGIKGTTIYIYEPRGQRAIGVNMSTGTYVDKVITTTSLDIPIYSTSVFTNTDWHLATTLAVFKLPLPFNSSSTATILHEPVFPNYVFSILPVGNTLRIYTKEINTQGGGIAT